MKTQKYYSNLLGDVLFPKPACVSLYEQTEYERNMLILSIILIELEAEVVKLLNYVEAQNKAKSYLYLLDVGVNKLELREVKVACKEWKHAEE